MTLLVESRWTLELSLSGTPVPHTFDVLSVNLTRDRRNTVYCQGQIVVARSDGHEVVVPPGPGVMFDGLDVSTFELRAVLTGFQSRDGVALPSETLHLVVFAVDFAQTGELTLSVASEEVIAECRALVATVGVDHSHEIGIWIGDPPVGSSARQAISETLHTYLGRQLTSTAFDAEATIGRRLELVNRVPNPAFTTTDASMWVNQANATSITGTVFGYLTFAASGAGNAGIRLQPRLRVSTGKAYYFQAWLYSQNNARSKGLYLRFYNSEGGFISEIGSSYTADVNTWVRYAMVVPPWNVPKDAVEVEPVIRSLSNTAGNVTRVDAVAFYELPDGVIRSAPGEPVSRWRIQGWNHEFDQGALPVVGGGGFGFASVYDLIDCVWNGNWYEPGASGAIPGYTGISDPKLNGITPIVEHDLFLTIMQPGQKVREFVDPLVNLTGGRLFHQCESDDWLLVTDRYDTGEPTLNLTGVVIERENRLDVTEELDGVPTVFTGVVLVYETTDPKNGLPRTYIDVAGDDSGNVLVKRFRDEKYPGAGAAAEVLARAAARVSRMTLTAIADWTAKPSRQARFMVNGVPYIGTLSAVTHQWGADGGTDTMRLTMDDVTLALPELVGTDSAYWDLNGDGIPTPFDVAVPVCEPGDLLVAVMAIYSAGGTPAIFAGDPVWTELGRTSGGETELGLFYKIADGTETNVVALTTSHGPSRQMGRVMVFRGANTIELGGMLRVDSSGTSYTPTVGTVASEPGVGYAVTVAAAGGADIGVVSSSDGTVGADTDGVPFAYRPEPEVEAAATYAPVSLTASTPAPSRSAVTFLVYRAD